jgi:predicted transcriptional regulator YdeE
VIDADFRSADPQDLSKMGVLPSRMIADQEVSMNTEIVSRPIFIVGLELRTSNDVAFETLPAHWQRFMSEGILERIPNRASDDMYAVYTNYENQGRNNSGVYSCVLGAPVTSLEDVPSDLIAVSFPAGTYQMVPVPSGRADLVGEAWQAVWREDASNRAFIADGERYRTDGRIDLLLGLRP